MDPRRQRRQAKQPRSRSRSSNLFRPGRRKILLPLLPPLAPVQFVSKLPRWEKRPMVVGPTTIPLTPNAPTPRSPGRHPRPRLRGRTSPAPPPAVAVVVPHRLSAVVVMELRPLPSPPKEQPPTLKGSGPNGELTLKDIPVSGISFQEVFNPDHEGPPLTKVIIYKPKGGKGQPTAKVIVTKVWPCCFRVVPLCLCCDWTLVCVLLGGVSIMLGVVALRWKVSLLFYLSWSSARFSSMDSVDNISRMWHGNDDLWL